MLNLVWLTKAVDQGVGEVAPLVVVTNVGKVDEGANTESHPQPGTLPGKGAQVTTRHPEGVKVLRGRGGRGRERNLLNFVIHPQTIHCMLV